MGFLGNLDTALTWILPCLFIVDGFIKVFPINIELFGEIVSFCTGTVRIKIRPVPKFDYVLKEIIQPHVGFRTVLFS